MCQSRYIDKEEIDDYSKNVCLNGVAIVGVGQSRFGNRTDASPREIAFEAAKKALEDAGLATKDIDFTVVGNALGDSLISQSVPGSIVVDYLGLAPKGSLRVEAACATGSAAIRTGFSFVKSKESRIVLVIGFEKMNEVTSAHATEVMARASDSQWEYVPYRITFPAFYAMMARAHMNAYGTSEEDLANVAVKNHKYGAMNENAHMQKRVTVEDVLESKMIASPLKLLDCSLITDGAACVILASEDEARSITDCPVWITGIGAATESAYFAAKPEITGIRSAKIAANEAYKIANVEPNDVDVATVHDCFTIAEIMAYEDLGFCEKGQGADLVREGQTELGGKVPVNMDGGLKAKGHPIGATGVSMAVEITKQLRGECGKRQVGNAEVGLTHNVGNTGQYSFVHVFSR